MISLREYSLLWESVVGYVGRRLTFLKIGILGKI